MKKNKPVDYLEAVRDFDKSLGRKPHDFDLPLKSSVVSDVGVDYLAVSREYEKHLNSDQSEVIYDTVNKGERIGEAFSSYYAGAGNLSAITIFQRTLLYSQMR